MTSKEFGLWFALAFRLEVYIGRDQVGPEEDHGEAMG